MRRRTFQGWSAAVLLWSVSLSPPALAAERGLTVRNGVLLKDGKPFRAFGINAVSLADNILAKGEAAATSFRAIEYLGSRKIPFIRFWASYFDNWKPYQEDPRRYWHNMDLLVAACEKAGIGLVPTLFWNAWTVPFYFGEFRSAWLDEDSQTRQFAVRYTREFVLRYRHRRAIWLWEFSNEDNLAWDLPNALTFVPDGHKDNRNIVRAAMGTLAERTFAREVRRHDRRRPISSGASEVRTNQFHLASIPIQPGATWGEDTPEQAAEATSWTAPAPIDVLSVHHYEKPAAYSPAAAREWLRIAGERAAALKRPLFLGEFGIMARWTRTPAELADAAYRAAMSDYFAAVFESRAALAAYWAFTPDSRPFIGSVGPEYKRFEYVVDLMAEYNRKWN